jgi:hypothetical protein
MAISDLKGIIDATITTNGRQEITGASLNEVLTQMVDATDAELTELSQETELLKGAVGGERDTDRGLAEYEDRQRS